MNELYSYVNLCARSQGAKDDLRAYAAEQQRKNENGQEKGRLSGGFTDLAGRMTALFMTLFAHQRAHGVR